MDLNPKIGSGIINPDLFFGTRSMDLKPEIESGFRNL